MQTASSHDIRYTEGASLKKTLLNSLNWEIFGLSHLLTVVFTSLLENCSTQKFFVEPNKWKSEGVRSGLLGECDICSQPNSLIY